MRNKFLGVIIPQFGWYEHGESITTLPLHLTLIYKSLPFSHLLRNSLDHISDYLSLACLDNEKTTLTPKKWG
ncbi:hypothetical protein [Paenibacillus phytorum]|uniref:hypothetical protein n=1 Tax=Paenibacillus phytorum TaxID=2654977 RepID=UPI001492AADA|nr:hypothetical protein [Paenibacillus phytorum]